MMIPSLGRPHSTRPRYLLIGSLALVAVLAACAATDSDSQPTAGDAELTDSAPARSTAPQRTVPGIGVPSGTYWYQWRGYLAAHEEDALYPSLTFQLARADVGEAVTEAVPTSYAAFSLVTDRGLLEAQVDHITPSPSGANHRVVSMVVTLDRPSQGLYEFTEVEYQVSDDDVPVRVAVGHWIIEVVEGASPTTLEEGHRLAGSTDFIGASTALENTSRETVTVEGLGLDLGQDTTGYIVKTAAFSEDPTSMPVPSPTASVVVRPGQTAFLELRYQSPLAQADASFVQVQPFIEYAAANRVERMALGRQIFATSFDGDADLGDYLRTLPANAVSPPMDE